MAKNTIKQNAPSKPTAKPDIQDKLKAEVSKQKEMLDGVKEAFRDAQERDIRLSDNVLFEVIVRAKDWDERDDDQKIALLLSAEETAGKVMVSDPGISKLISKMDEDFHKEVHAVLEAGRKSKSSAVDMLAQFRRIYTQKELDSMPMPGTEPAHVEGTPYRADKTKKNTPQGEPISVTWSNDFVSAMPEGKEAETTMSLIDKEWDNPNTTSYKSCSKDELSDIYEAAKMDRNALRSLVKRAIKLHHRLIAIGKLNAIGIRFIGGSKTKGIAMPTRYGLGELGEHVQMVTTGPKPLWIYNQDDPSKGRDFSVTQVLAFQPELARQGEHGGNMEDLLKTAGKGPDEPGDGSGDGRNMADDEAQATLSQFYNWINVREHKALVLKKIADRAKDADGNDWLDLCGSIYLAVKPIYDKNKAAYEALQVKEEPQSETKETEAA